MSVSLGGTKLTKIKKITRKKRQQPKMGGTCLAENEEDRKLNM